MDDKENEIHHLQFTDQNGDLPTSITILIRHKKDKTPLSTDDVLDVHEELKSFAGSITPLLKK